MIAQQQKNGKGFAPLAVDRLYCAIASLTSAIAETIPNPQTLEVLDGEEALEAWEQLEPIQQRLEDMLNRLEDILTQLVDQIGGGDDA